ncbi:zinc finger protein CONSTANS-LIKE 16-like [Senna tora]|uniref:Zinc finger protein CONSTANS-LIKE 16-like n=1 Tax=Senna tora TaxID=362788 RepID=A0A834SS47_9FABA|nr:zinc finger protein CONSTANS-LIKE 16-like [Senna tora]
MTCSGNKSVAKAVAAKTARACDSCIRKRARWYCAADDAFLCQSCDSLVHSANPLARRHQRLRLKTSSFKPFASSDPPAWHTKKPRTPRNAKHHLSWAKHQTPRGHPDQNETCSRNPFFHYLVPEVGSDEYSNSHDENDEQLLYRVPIFDPFVEEAQLCSTKTEETRAPSSENNNHGNATARNDSVEEFLPSEMELAEFAADVESLLGRGLENECIGMEDLGLIDNTTTTTSVKVEDEEERISPACKVELDSRRDEIGSMREAFELSLDYDESPGATCEGKRNILLLQLDYEAGRCGMMMEVNYGRAMGDGGREARVSRYREKRRTRLFSKKIRYEVRKLNAEKRPRMKGRFVKRASFAGVAVQAPPPPPAFPLICSANK